MYVYCTVYGFDHSVIRFDALNRRTEETEPVSVHNAAEKEKKN